MTHVILVVSQQNTSPEPFDVEIRVGVPGRNSEPSPVMEWHRKKNWEVGTTSKDRGNVGKSDLNVKSQETCGERVGFFRVEFDIGSVNSSTEYLHTETKTGEWGYFRITKTTVR